MSSGNTCRLDSWWIEKRWLSERLTVRVGQFAGQDFYGAQHYAASFIFEPMGYALGNLFTDFESFDPPSTPALEVRVVPIQNFYLKSMVLAAVSSPYSQNPTGLVPQFNGTPMSVSEIGFTPGKKATSVRAFDNVETRKGYSGLYQFGASYNPGKFASPTSAKPQRGNYLLYWMASQALWRVDPKGGKGLDGTFAYDWSPSNINRNNTMLTAGLRFNEPLFSRGLATVSDEAVKEKCEDAPKLVWLSHIVGGLAFGFGMTLASGCGSKTLIRAGAGSLRALVTLLVMVVFAWFTLRGIFSSHAGT